VAWPLPGSQQGNPILGRQLKRLRQAAYREEMRIPARAPFQIGDPAHAEFTSTEVVYGVTGTDVTELPECGVSP
jgi:hypothetical protein